MIAGGVDEARQRLASRLALHEILELLVEAGEPAAAVDQVLLAARPCGMGGRIDVECQLRIRLAPGRPNPIARAVVKDDIHEMIVGMDAFFHGTTCG